MRLSLAIRRDFLLFRIVRQWHRVLGEVAKPLSISGIFQAPTRQSPEEFGLISELIQL